MKWGKRKIKLAESGVPAELDPIPLLNFDVEGLAREVWSIELEPVANGSGRARGEGTNEGWITGLSMARIDLNSVRLLQPLLAQAIINLQRRIGGEYRVTQIMVNRLAANTGLDRHRNGEGDYLRFHLPIRTAPGVTWWDEHNGRHYLEVGSWYRVRYNVLHSMTNDSPIARVHVIVDLKLSDAKL